MNSSAKMEQIDVLRIKLAMLRQEHRDLDTAIQALHDQGMPNMLTLQRLKRQKLSLKDQIAQLEDRIIPDITA